MKFHDKYPDAKDGDMPGGSGTDDWDALLCPTQDRCWHCGELTQWVSISFEAALCSEECAAAKWQEYFEACTSSPWPQLPDDDTVFF